MILRHCIGPQVNLVMSFARTVIALWIYKTCFISLLVNCAALERRQGDPYSLSQSSRHISEASPSNDQNVMLIMPDTTGGVTSVTKVISVTSFIGPQGTISSTAPDPSDGDSVITKVVRVGATTVDPANCTPALCRAYVDVSGNLLATMVEQLLNLDLGGLSLLLASRVCKNSVSLHDLQFTISGAPIRIGSVSI